MHQTDFIFDISLQSGAPLNVTRKMTLQKNVELQGQITRVTGQKLKIRGIHVFTHSLSFPTSYDTGLYVLQLVRRRFSKTRTVKTAKFHQNFSFSKIEKNLFIRPKTAMVLINGEFCCPHFGESFKKLSPIVTEKSRFEVFPLRGDNSKTKAKFKNLARACLS